MLDGFFALGDPFAETQEVAVALTLNDRTRGDLLGSTVALGR
jgi:hypothetical protein